MKEMVRYAVTLSLICIVASASLAIVNSITRPRILAQGLAEEESGLKEIFPEAENFAGVKSGDEVIYYKAFDKNGGVIGFAFKASGKGYSSTIETLAGMTPEGKLTAIKVISQNETPGLGGQVAEKEFGSRFSNKEVQNLSEVSAITGATISSRAVIDSVKNKAQEIQGLISHER